MGLPVPPHVSAAAETFRYNRRVFALPPWPEIFSQDAERKQDFAEAIRIAQAEFDELRPDVVVGSSRGGAIAMNINSDTA